MTKLRLLTLLTGLALFLLIAGCGLGGSGQAAEGGEPAGQVRADDGALEDTIESQSSESNAVSDSDQSRSTTTTATSTTSSTSSSTTATASTITADPPTTTAAAPTTESPSTTEPTTTRQPTSEPTTTDSVAEAESGTSVLPVAEGPRQLVAQNWSVMATYEEVTLLHPSNRVERVGFHESNHDGARQLVPAPSAVNPLVLETRNRDTGSHTAADVVVEPDTEVRAPVTGTVIRAGGYILYCKHNDDFVVIEPDSHPGWEVKVLHIDGVMVGKGDRVEAGVTVLAPAATPLPFDSQVDDHTAEPSWPHVHIELVDPSIPDRPSEGGGC